MQFADRPGRFDVPGQCAIVPGRVHDENGGVLLDGVYDGVRGDIRVWLSHGGLQRLVQLFGDRLNLAARDELDMTREHLENTERLLEQAQTRIEELEARQERINGIARDGFKIVRQTGRPKQKVAS